MIIIEYPRKIEILNTIDISKINIMPAGYIEVVDLEGNCENYRVKSYDGSSPKDIAYELEKAFTGGISRLSFVMPAEK